MVVKKKLFKKKKKKHCLYTEKNDFFEKSLLRNW